MMHASLPFMIAFLLHCAVLQAADIGFAKPPAVSKQGATARVSFAISASTDVEVAVLNAKGEVVRHLAAGVLGGEKAPPAPLKPGLAQRLAWDGKDDFGKPASGGPFKFRVRAGIEAKFGRLIGEDPYTFGAMDGVACDEAGNVYVMGRQGTHNQSSRTLRVYDPDGRYLRELIPFPANLSPGVMKDVAQWDAAAERWHPRNTSCLVPEFYTSGGMLIGASTKNGILMGDATNLYQLQPDGSVKGDQFCTRKLMWEKKFHHWGGIAAQGKTCMATSPDGRYVYLSGIHYARDKFKDMLKPGNIYRLDLKAPGGTMQPFVSIDGSADKWKRGGADSKEGTAPTHGIDVDTQGRVYICDREHDEIAVFDPAGKKLFAIPVANPDCVDVIGGGEAMYVVRRLRVGYYKHEVELQKYLKPGPDARPVASLKLSSTTNPGLAVSMRGGQATIWISGLKEGLLAYADAGSTFVLKETQFRPRKDGQVDWNRMSVDYQRDEIYVADGGNKIWRYDGKTGDGGLLKKGDKPLAAVDLAVGYNGLLYIRTGASFSGPLERYTRDLQPAPFASGNHVLSSQIYSRYGIGNCEKGLGVGPKGECYISFLYTWVGYGIGGFDENGKGISGPYLKGLFPTDKAENRKNYPAEMDGAVVGPIPGAGGGVRVDLQGNIYVGIAGRQADQAVNSAYAKDAVYSTWTGSVLKFEASGGAILGIQHAESKRADAPKIPLVMGKAKWTAEGATQCYYGLGPISGGGPGGNSSCCVCRVPRFDVDRYGRVALPSAYAPTTILYDNAGNLIAEIGRYGNFDSQYVPAGAKDGKALVDVPGIPVAWPSGTGFSKHHLYINDTTNRRVVRVDWTWQAEKEVSF